MASDYYPQVPDNQIEGQILSVARGVQSIGQYDVVVLNKGEVDGVTRGTVFEVFQKGKVVRDEINEELVQLPSEKAGALLVFRTFDRLSYGVVLDATTTMSVGDRIETPLLIVE